MSKDPAVLFYTSDFISGTLTMSYEQKGKYIILLCLQHQKGHLTKKDMLNICGSYDKDIFDKFIEIDGKFFNERMKNEIIRRKEYCQSRSDNRKGVKKQIKKRSKISKTYDQHMETETITINKDNINKVNKKDKSLEEKRIKLETRRASFTQEVLSHKEYPQDMLIAFANWWSEADKSYTKMKFEKQETWELDRRLNTWASRNKEFIKQPKTKYHATDY